MLCYTLVNERARLALDSQGIKTMKTIKDLKKHIKKCNKRGMRYNFLGLVENNDLSPEVESLFTLEGIGMSGYDWVNGNNKMKALVKSIN